MKEKDLECLIGFECNVHGTYLIYLDEYVNEMDDKQRVEVELFKYCPDCGKLVENILQDYRDKMV